jgi:hypothetical protein
MGAAQAIAVKLNRLPDTQANVGCGLLAAPAEIQRPPVPVVTSLESLIGLRWHDGPDVRPTLLRVLTDLYVQKPSHNKEEQQQYVELALRLIDAADAGLRDEILHRLSGYEGAPTAVLHQLTTQPALGPAVPAVASSNEERAANEHWQPELNAAAAELSDIFFSAAPLERRLIMICLDYSGLACEPMPQALTSAANARLEAAALQGRLEEFVREFEATMRISRNFAQRVVNDISGEPLVVAAKALAMPIDGLQRILLCVNPGIGHSVRRVYSLSALYREISVPAALRLLMIWRAAAPATTRPEEQRTQRPEARSLRDVAQPRRVRPQGADLTARPPHQTTR